MNLFFKLRLHLVLFVLSLALIISCSNASLFKGQATASSSAAINFCTTPSTQVVTKLKYFFVTDVSGSNQQNYLITGPTATPVPDTANPAGTDPTGVRRYSGLVNFFTAAASATPLPTNVYYAAMHFSGQPSFDFTNQSPSAWYNNGTPTSAAQMLSGYTGIWCANGQTPPNCNAPNQDGGFTNYLGTLQTIHDAIVKDLQYEQQLVAQGGPLQASSYVIFWTSDGFPYDQNGPQNVGAVIQNVQDIMNLKGTQQYGPYIASITLNTAFYWTSSVGIYEYQQAIDLMQEMANIGNGNYVQVSTGSDINYAAFAVPNQYPPFTLRDIWIHDASAVWWNGTLMLDSDNDGIPDQIETQWGSNPNAYDSDHNGVGDGVEYFLWGTPCNSISTANLGKAGQTCTTGGAKTSFRGSTAGCSNPGAYPNVYPDTDADNLNDCEEGLLGTSNIDSDSNQDFVPDQLEWLYNVPYLYGTSGLNANPTGDGQTNYTKLKELFPISVPFSQIRGVVPLAYTLKQTSSNNIQTCYAVQVNQIATMSNNDVLRIYIMESEGAAGASLRRMRTLKNITRITGSNITLNDGDFTP